MIIRLLKTNQPAGIPVLVILAAAMWFVSWQQNFEIFPANGMPLYDLIIYLVSGWPKATVALLGLALLLGQAFHLNYILNKHEVLYKQTWLPALMYIMIAGIFPDFLSFHPLLLVNTIILFALDQLFLLYKSSSPLSPDFNSSFLFACASLIYFPVVVFFILHLLGIILLRPFNWREWMVGIIGFVLPFFFAFLWYFMNNMLIGFYDRVFISGINKQPGFSDLFPYQYAFSVIILLVMLVLSLLRLQGNYYKNVTRARIIQQVMMLFTVIAVLSVLVSRNNSLYRYYLLAIPFAVFLAYYFLSGRKGWWMEILFLVLIVCWVYNYFLI